MNLYRHPVTCNAQFDRCIEGGDVEVILLTFTHPDEGVNWDVMEHPGIVRRFKTIVANRSARDKGGLRCIGATQISFCYDKHSVAPPKTPEEFEAARVLQELGRRRMSDNVIIVDLHSNKLGLEYFDIGRISKKGAIVLADIWGIHDIIVSPYSSFYQSVPSGVAFELREEHLPGFIGSFFEEDNPFDQLESMSLSDIHNRYMECVNEMRFWQCFEILALEEAEDGKVICLADWEQSALIKLEDIEPGDAFTPVPDKAIGPLYRFGVFPKMGRPHFLYWGYRNNSKPYPEIIGYTKRGEPRKLCFGAVVVPVNPPELADSESCPSEQDIFFDGLF